MNMPRLGSAFRDASNYWSKSAYYGHESRKYDVFRHASREDCARIPVLLVDSGVFFS